MNMSIKNDAMQALAVYPVATHAATLSLRNPYGMSHK
jgi:hypothetical protein